MNSLIIKKARLAFWNRDYNNSKKLYDKALELYPEMWWIELEKIRSIKKQQQNNYLFSKYNDTMFLYSPDYKGNSYQKILYSSYYEKKSTLSPLSIGNFDKFYENWLQNPKKLLFHQHWLREIYRNKECKDIDKYFRRLRVIKAFGGKVIWTVHNIIDHDLNDLELKLNKKCLKNIVDISDRILVHSLSSISELKKEVSKINEEKFHLLKHPLYDSMMFIERKKPLEICHFNLDNKVIYLSFGMIRKYKGTLDLVSHFLKEIKENNINNAILIIAGKVYDRELKEFLKNHQEILKNRLIIIDRRISDHELAYLCKIADIAVLPYRKIMISGSYYQATTFSLPSIVPDIGMFHTEVVDGKNGIKYHGQKEIGLALKRAYQIGKKKLKKIGEQAFLDNKGQEGYKISHQFHNHVKTVLVE